MAKNWLSSARTWVSNAFVKGKALFGLVSVDLLDLANRILGLLIIPSDRYWILSRTEAWRNVNGLYGDARIEVGLQSSPKSLMHYCRFLSKLAGCYPCWGMKLQF